MSGSSTGKFLAIIILFLSLLVFISCGLEDYPYIDNIPQSNITQEMNYRAIVRIPSTNTSAFSRFIIFYRIYVSNRSEQSPTPGIFSTMNSVLAQDYNSIAPYIDSDTLVNTNMDTLFSGRQYKYLFLENHNIDDVLSDESSYPSIRGATLIFDFSSSKNPTMTIGSSVYTLMRSNGNGAFNPLPPDRYFVNREDLWKSENINANTNADVVNMSGITESDLHFTYVAMFIAAAGINPNTWSYIYSTPSLIHVFELPPQW